MLAEMAEVLAAQAGKGLSVKAAFAREAGSPGEAAVPRVLACAVACSPEVTGGLMHVNWYQ